MITKNDVKKKLVEFNGGSARFGTVFDSVCETVAYFANAENLKAIEKEKLEEMKKGNSKVDKGI